MNDNLAQKIRTGANVYGTCIISTSPVWPESVLGAGLDFVFIDTEHIPVGRAELASLCRRYNALGLPAIVRISSPDPFLACMARDAGAVGVMAPYVEAEKQILDLAGATKLRPLKGEKLRRVLSGEEAPGEELQKYLNNYNQGSLCLINIESLVAVERLDALLSVPGLDAVIIGPHDLSINMGLPEHYDHPEFEAVVRTIIHTARAKGLGAGIHFPGDPRRQVRWMKEGVNIVMHGSDMHLFNQKLRDDLALIRNSAGDGSESQGAPGMVI